MTTADVWIAKDDGTEIIRAREIVAVSLDDGGNVTARLAGDAALVTLARGQAHQDERQPANFHRDLIQIVAELRDSSGAHLVRPVHDESRGWVWVSERL